MSSCTVRRKIIGAIAAAFLVFASVAAVPSTAFAHEAEDDVAVARVMYDDVIDTYLQYKCPNGYSAHNNYQYGIVYKTISYKSGYKAKSYTPVASWSANVCGCGYGTVTRIKVGYSTW